MAKRIAINAKCQRRESATRWRRSSFIEAFPGIPQGGGTRLSAQGVEIRADETAYAQLATLNYQPGSGGGKGLVH